MRIARYFLVPVFFFFFLSFTCTAQPAGTVAQIAEKLVITEPRSGIQLSVINREYPLLKILLPGQGGQERGIEVEFPEHVTGTNAATKISDHLYLVTWEDRNRRTAPAWTVTGNTIRYESVLNGNITMIATAVLTPDGVAYTYQFSNRSTISYEKLQAVTCVKLYADFSDTRLTRTYVHHTTGFELLASETPERVTMPLHQWLPCRYLVSYTWPIVPRRMEKDEDGITRYHKSRKVDKPVIATLSQDKRWVAATYTGTTGNIWTNPERSCHHADPYTSLKPGETSVIHLKTLLFKGKLEQVLQKIQSK